MKKFEILNSLPSYGLMYISVTADGEPYYSEGFVVRFFKSDGTNWVANFKPGPTDSDNEWKEFTYNIETKILNGGSYPFEKPKKRSWWKT